ncbi:MAG: Flagellar protein FliL, partial [Thermodesulfobacteriota bacterium]|nr:Flagellar protein FliL [Thermodesulfobacteriota bacterium]
MKINAKIAGILLSGACVAALAAYSLMPEKPYVNEKPVKHEEVTEVREKGSVDFEPFIAPFGQDGSYTYMKVDVSFGVSDDKLLDEMREKRNL